MLYYQSTRVQTRVVVVAVSKSLKVAKTSSVRKGRGDDLANQLF